MPEEKYTYEAKTWKNYPDTSTPLNAENLQYMDNGIAKAHERLDNIDISNSLTASNGINLNDNNLSLDTNYIFHTIFEYAAHRSDDNAAWNLGQYASAEMASNFRYIIVDFYYDGFEPTQSQTFWINAHTITNNQDQSATFALLGQDYTYVLLAAMVYRDGYIHGRDVSNENGGLGHTTNKRGFIVTRVQGVR